MQVNQSIAGHVAILIVAAIACLIPTPWISFPAATALVLWLPGRLVLRCLRDWQATRGRVWMALGASLVLMPVPLAWIWRWSNSFAAILAGVLSVNIVLLLLAWRGKPAGPNTPMFPTRRARLLFALLLGWMSACVFGAYWIPGVGGRVATRAAHDYVKHHAVMLSLAQAPLPLHNMFYAAAADTPHYYYEYHYLVPAALRKLSGDRVSIGFAFGVSSAVLAATFIALTYLLALALLESAVGALFAAACVSVVGGWDVIPVALQMAQGAGLRIVLDSWCPVPWRIHNIATQFIWCPQHIVAVLALMLACLWLRRAPTAGWWIVLAPLLGASIFGSSVYLAITIFLAAAVYVLLLVARSRRDPAKVRRTALSIGAIALLGAGLMGLQAWQYHVMSGRFPGGLTLTWERFDYALLGRILPSGPLANYLDAWWIVLIEFGLPALACVLVARALWSVVWRDTGGRLLLLASAIGAVALFTVRCNINPGFDYSFRIAIMPANVLAAICAGALLTGDRLRRFARRLRWPVLIAGVLLGLPVGLYETPLMALRTLLRDEPHFADAGAIRFLRAQTPRDAVIQGDPVARVNLPQLTDRRMGVLDPENPHVRVFTPPDFEQMRAASAEVEAAFTTDSSAAACKKLRAAGVTHVLVGSAERRRFGGLPQFLDQMCFQCVYADEHAAVYSVIRSFQNARESQQATSIPTERESP